MEYEFNELLFCHFDDDCVFITVDDDKKLKGFTAKPKYFKEVGKWLLDSVGETFVINHFTIKIDDDKPSIKIIERSSYSDDWFMYRIAYPSNGINNGSMIPNKVSKIQDLVKNRDSIKYEFKHTHYVELSGGDRITISHMMALEFGNLGYRFVKPDICDQFLRIHFSSDKHRDYIRNTYDYTYEGINNALIVTDSEYKKMHNTIAEKFTADEIQNIIKKVKKDYV